MTEQVKGPAAKAEDPSSIPGTHLGNGKKNSSLRLSSDLHMHPVAWVTMYVGVQWEFFLKDCVTKLKDPWNF